MRTVRSVATLAATLTLTGLFVATPARADVGTATVSGVVRNNDGTPRPNVTVTIARLVSTSTGADGSWTLDAPTGEQVLTIGDLDGVGQDFAGATRLDVGSASSYDVTLPPTAPLSVTVLDEAGDPLGGAELDVSSQGIATELVPGVPGYIYQYGLQAGVTAPDGVAVLERFVGDQGTVRGGRRPASVPYVGVKNLEPVPFSVPDTGASISVTVPRPVVLTTTSRTADGRFVQLAGTSTGLTGVGEIGTFADSVLPAAVPSEPSRLELRALLADTSVFPYGLSLDATWFPTADVTADLTLPAPVAASIQLVDEAGAPVAASGLRFVVSSTFDILPGVSADSRQDSWGTTDDNGTINLELFPGTLSVYSGGLGGEVSVTAAGTYVVTLSNTIPTAIFGAVTSRSGSSATASWQSVASASKVTMAADRLAKDGSVIGTSVTASAPARSGRVTVKGLVPAASYAITIGEATIVLDSKAPDAPRVKSAVRTARTVELSVARRGVARSAWLEARCGTGAAARRTVVSAGSTITVTKVERATTTCRVRALNTVGSSSWTSVPIA